MKTSNSNHLTLEDRVRIETMLSEGFSARYIALRLDKSPSTISRELKKHSFVRIPRHCDCLNSSSCYCRHVCGASSCPKKCKLCSKAKKYCQDYVQVFCDSLIDHPLHLCNSCSKEKSAISNSVSIQLLLHISSIWILLPTHAMVLIFLLRNSS